MINRTLKGPSPKGHLTLKGPLRVTCLNTHVHCFHVVMNVVEHGLKTGMTGYLKGPTESLKTKKSDKVQN